MQKKVVEFKIGEVVIRLVTKDETSYIEEHEELRGPSLPQLYIDSKDVTNGYINVVVDHYFDGRKMIILSLIIDSIKEYTIDDNANNP